MKTYRIWLADKDALTVQADSFHQVGGFITFYTKRPSGTEVSGIVCMGSGDTILEINKPALPCPDCGYKPGERGGAVMSGAKLHVKTLIPDARSVLNEQQGWMILAGDASLNIACGFGQPDYCKTEEEAWTAALALQGLAARDRVLRKWPNAHAVQVGKLGWVVLGEEDTKNRVSASYAYPLAITHNCTFCTTEIGAWLDADERDAKGHPTWNPNRLTGSTRETDEYNAAVNQKLCVPKGGNLKTQIG